jgi:membrane protease YdiL (CAAX protease family)
VTEAPPQPAGFWLVLRLLLAAAYRRSVGRRRRQRELMSQRVRSKTANWPDFMFALLVVVMALLNLAAGYQIQLAVAAGERSDAERHGWVVVSRSFIDQVNRSNNSAVIVPQAFRDRRTAMDKAFHAEARDIASEQGGTAQLLDADTAAPGIKLLPSLSGIAPLLGSLPLIAWFIMLTCWGEGLELDVQRRRHPMWEWLFSHPVPPSAVFLAELLSPIAANPIYLGAPLFVLVAYALVYGLAWGMLAGALIGIPLTVAAACLGKGLEIAIALRFPPRSRGAVIGLMSWLGYATMMGFVAVIVTFGRIFPSLARLLAPAPTLHWDMLGLFLGATTSGFSFGRGLLTGWAFAALIIAGSVWFSIWGAHKGLGGNQGDGLAAPGAAPRGGAGFGKYALYRKELLWFARDRSALVQAVLVPLTMAGFQLFNDRRLLSQAEDAWYSLCGAAILFGTYFLLVLGPKSLASEGAALWITLTWPHGLEQLLKAKAWLWTMLSSALVAPVLCYAAILFPASAWQVVLVAIAWLLFARSMAAKTVTLASITSESGEIQKVPKGRRWAAQLGMVTFAIGVLTQQWSVALAGVAYSSMTAAAMWQNFRARLPYLYDPWSETLPTPPTLMHAMIAISILVESVAVITAGRLVFLPRQQVGVLRAAVYGVCATVVSLAMLYFLYRRGVRPADLWRWRPQPGAGAASWRGWQLASPGLRNLLASLALGVAAGLALGAVGLLYLMILRHIPTTAALLDQARAQLNATPYLRAAMLGAAVVFAPFAEEFLFRGLLYRTLDREFGGWRAIAASAAFFAMYHPPLSWLPVGLLGVVNALLFKHTGRLAPAVVVHMVYNAIIVGAS